MLVSVDKLKPYSKNPKEEFTTKQYKAFIKSIEEWGFNRNLFICKDFETNTDDYIVLDGNTAIKALKDLEIIEIECMYYPQIIDHYTAQSFIAQMSISKKTLYSRISKYVGADLEELIGKATTIYETIDTDEAIEKAKKTNVEYMEQTSYLLSLKNGEIVKNVKSFVRSKTYKVNPEQAIIDKIEKMDESEFLSELFNIILE